MNTTTAKLPPWFDRYNPAPTASPRGWLNLKIANGDRETLIQTQREYEAVMREMPAGNPRDLAKARWRTLREEYRRTSDARILDQLDELGEQGATLATELYARKHVIRDSARRVAAAKNCGPIYVKVFEAAVEIILERVADTERAEREANEILDVPYSPSGLLKGLASLASYFKTQAECYRESAGDLNYLAPPAQALGPELWASVTANSERKPK